MATTLTNSPWNESWFYSSSVEEKKAVASFVEMCTSFGFHYSHSLTDFDGQRQNHQGQFDELELPSSFQQLQLNIKYQHNSQRRTLQVTIYPGRRLLQANTGEATEEMLESILEALKVCFPRHDQAPLSPARQTEINDIFSDLESLKVGYKTSLTDQTSSAKSLHETHVENFKALEQTYKEHMKLKAPVEYWETREKEYRKTAKNRVGLLSLSIMAAICVLVASAAKAAPLFSTKAPPIWLLGVVAIVVSLVVWGLRVLSMAYFSALHLAEDARFRAEVTIAYLALLSDGSAESSDRHLVLSELFRPVNFGLLKNEGPPIGLIDAVRKLNGS